MDDVLFVLAETIGNCVGVNAFERSDGVVSVYDRSFAGGELLLKTLGCFTLCDCSLSRSGELVFEE